MDRAGDPGYSAAMDLIIFDLDGTLINSEAILLGAQVETFARHGLVHQYHIHHMVLYIFNGIKAVGEGMHFVTPMFKE